MMLIAAISQTTQLICGNPASTNTGMTTNIINSVAALGACAAAIAAWRTQTLMIKQYEKEENTKSPLMEINKIEINRYIQPDEQLPGIQAMIFSIENILGTKLKDLHFDIFAFQYKKTDIIGIEKGPRNGGSSIGLKFKAAITFDFDKYPKDSLYFIAFYYNATDIYDRTSGPNCEFYLLSLRHGWDGYEECVPVTLSNSDDINKIRESIAVWCQLNPDQSDLSVKELNQATQS